MHQETFVMINYMWECRFQTLANESLFFVLFKKFTCSKHILFYREYSMLYFQQDMHGRISAAGFGGWHVFVPLSRVELIACASCIVRVVMRPGQKESLRGMAEGMRCQREQRSVWCTTFCCCAIHRDIQELTFLRSNWKNVYRFFRLETDSTRDEFFSLVLRYELDKIRLKGCFFRVCVLPDSTWTTNECTSEKKTTLESIMLTHLSQIVRRGWMHTWTTYKEYLMASKIYMSKYLNDSIVDKYL